MSTYPGVAHPEPLLNHNGGPGSSASSGTTFKGPEYEKFAVFGITQRGVSWWNQSAWRAAAPTPMFECSAADMRLPPKQPGRSYAISDFTSCACAFVDGTPLIGQSFAAIDPENASAVQGIFERMAERGRRCTAQSKWQLDTRAGGRRFNFLEWSSTSMLAHDLERLRGATCADKLNLHGYSYGTGVVATYLTKFPQSAGQAVINGNMPPTPESRTFAEGNGGAFTQAYAFLQQACALDTAYAPCANLTRAGTEAVWAGLLVRLRAGELYAPTGSGGRFALQIGLLAAHLQGLMIGASHTHTGWRPAVQTLANLTGGDSATAQATVGRILDGFCALPGGYDAAEWSGVRTWYEYDICVGKQSVGLDDAAGGGSGFIYEAAVLGQDYAGRYTVAQAMGIYRAYAAVQGPMATSGFIGIFAELFAWPALPTPSPVGFRSLPSAPLIIGNLHDPATAFAWTSAMRSSLPGAHLMIWQGVGHCLSARGNYDHSGMQPCLDVIAAYWRNGSLPVDGFTCRMQAPLPL